MPSAQERFRSPVETVTEMRDIHFTTVKNCSGEIEKLLLDVYLPAAPAASTRPVIFWFHGGGFRPGNDRRQIYIQIFARAFAEKGFVGIAPDYRVRPETDTDHAGIIRDAVEDGRAAVEWLFSHASEYKADPNRVLLAGGSAGGMLVASLVHHPSAPVDLQTTGIKGVISLWGPPWEKMRLFTSVNSNCPPTLLVHGTADALVPYGLSQSFARELQEAGVFTRLLTLQDAPHTAIGHSDVIIEQIEKFMKDDCDLT